MKLSPTELARLAYRETGWRGENLVIAVAIALGESGGDPAIKSKVDKADAKWGVSTGLWQIRPLQADKGKGGPRDETLLADPAHNARSAFQIYTFAGGSFSPWGAYTNGSYKRHYAAAKQGVQMAWRLVKSLQTLRAEIDAMAPNRDRSSDGTIGDSAHASRPSQHNPDSDTTVDALDIDHDPANGCDVDAIFAEIVRKRDRRVRNLIRNGRILAGNAGPSPWVWRERNKGGDDHVRHGHIDVLDAFQDDTSPWLTEKENGFMATLTDEEQKKLKEQVEFIYHALKNASPKTRFGRILRGLADKAGVVHDEEATG